MEDRTVFQSGLAGSVRRGTRLNDIYQVEGLLAQGGMGEVYSGFNIQTRDRIAIKMIRTEFLDNAEALELFRREASILHNLQHEAIVRYFVFSVDPILARAYLAMELVEGPSLTNRLASGPLPLPDVRLLLGRVASGLNAAHRLGVVHRDISPDNIILPDGSVRNAKIIDFGIAHLNRPGQGTIIGDGFAGKYSYVSPEQVGLAGGVVTFKSDIYSFGLVLAEALRGRPINMGGSQVEVIEKRRVVPDLSDLDRSIRPLIQAMLQPLPENRPASMAAVAAWGEKANSPSENEDGRAGKEWSARRSAGGQGAALIGALIAVVSLGGTGYIFRDEIVRWTQSLSGAGTPSGDQVPAPKVGVRAGIESTTTAKISPDALPQLRSELKQTAPPPLTSPEGQPLTSPFPSSATSAPVPPSMKTSPNDSQMGPAAPRLPGEQSTPPSHLQPRSQEVVNALSPRASHSIIGLPAATVGTPYHAELPGFIDPSGKGLRLAADSLPGGMTFTDLGDGSGEIGGTPQRQGSADIQIVATDHIGGTARMRASVVVAERLQPAEAKALPPTGPAANNPFDGKASATPVAPEPFSPSPPTAPAVGPFEVPTKLGTQVATTPSTPPRATIPVAVLEGASAGQDFVAELPTFVTSEMAGALTLRAEPNPPPGLRLVDLGGGASQISGKPIEPGSYSFDVIATDAADLSAKMEVRLLIAPPLTPSSPGSVQLPTVSDKVSAFIHGFDGGDCFMVTPQPGIAHGYLAVGRELAPFERFDAGYKTQVGAEPQLSLRLITNSECPALDLIRQDAGAAAGAPRIELKNYNVGRNMPLAGTITNLGNRHVVLIFIDNDGLAHRVQVNLDRGGESATFSVPLTPDSSSVGPMQILLAVVSSAPIPTLESFRPAPLKSIVPAILSEARSGSASVKVEFFKFAN